MVKPTTAWVTPLENPFWVRAAARYRKVRQLPPTNHPRALPRWERLPVYAGRYGLGTDVVYLARVDHGAMKSARKNAAAILNTGRYEAYSLYVLDPALLASAALHIDPETDLLARIDGFHLVAPGWKSCRECGHLDGELRLADVLPAVGIGKRIRFSKTGGGALYLAAGWADPEPWGTWSHGPAAEIVLPVAGDGVHGILIEADVPAACSDPVRDLEISVNGVLATTVGLTTSAAARLQVPIPEAAHGRLRKYGVLRPELRFPDAVRPQGMRIHSGSRNPAFGLLAITLTGT